MEINSAVCVSMATGVPAGLWKDVMLLNVQKSRCASRDRPMGTPQLAGDLLDTMKT